MSGINKVFSKISKHPITITLFLLSAILGIIGFFFFQSGKVQKAQIEKSPGSNLIQNSPGATIIQRSHDIQGAKENKKGKKESATTTSTSNILSQRMINSPGGIQAGRDVIVNQEPIVEMIDPKKDSNKWKFIKKNGETFLGLKLKYDPIVKTVIIRSTGQLIMTPSKEEFYEAGYYYALLIDKEEPETKMEKRIIKSIEDGEVSFEVRYLRKNQTETSNESKAP